ncbi:MAG: DNA polymerase IV [Bacillota bacterium]
MKELNIMHVDMDAFYASVEQKDKPELKNKPVIIGGNELGNRGVVATASYEARKYGIHSAMPVAKAKKLCPHGIFISGNMSRYQEESDRIFEILSGYTPLVEKISIDEAFLDLTGCHHLYGNSKKIGKMIKSEIKEKTDLNASIGLAPNKFLAKLASDLKKPDGFMVIYKERIAEIIDPLSVNKIWGVGKKTEEKLIKKGIKTIGKLKQVPRKELKAMFGSFGVKLYKLARGIDDRNVVPKNETKSISHETTFKESLTSRDKILAVLLILSEKVSRRLRKNNFTGCTIFIKIRYDDFKTYTRRNTLSYYFNDTENIYNIGKKLLEKEDLKKPIRLLGIGVSKLVQNKNKQMDLFNEDKEKLYETIDIIKNKYGENSILRARDLIYKKNKDS